MSAPNVLDWLRRAAWEEVDRVFVEPRQPCVLWFLRQHGWDRMHEFSSGEGVAPVRAFLEFAGCDGSSGTYVVSLGPQDGFPFGLPHFARFKINRTISQAHEVGVEVRRLPRGRTFEFAMLCEHPDLRPTLASFSPDGETLVCCQDNTLFVSPARWPCQWTRQTLPCRIESLAWSGHGELYLATLQGIFRRDPATGEIGKHPDLPGAHQLLLGDGDVLLLQGRTPSFHALETALPDPLPGRHSHPPAVRRLDCLVHLSGLTMQVLKGDRQRTILTAESGVSSLSAFGENLLVGQHDGRVRLFAHSLTHVSGFTPAGMVDTGFGRIVAVSTISQLPGGSHRILAADRHRVAMIGAPDAPLGVYHKPGSQILSLSTHPRLPIVALCASDGLRILEAGTRLEVVSHSLVGQLGYP